MKKEILEKTAREYFNSAEDESKKGRYNSAVVLFFKSLVSLIDLYVLQKIGKTPCENDLMIASIALANNLILITHNIKEFSRIENLKLEDWE